jgi:glycosyltransferase involved in cell wall biosynthesis
MQTDFASTANNNKRLSQSHVGSKLFAVVTVVFNSANDLESTIVSVSNQSFRDFQYIIIDGGSTDGTVDLISKYRHLIDYSVSEPDMGVYDAFNKACRQINAEWIIFLGAGDTFYNNETLECISNAMEHIGEETEIIYGKVVVNNNNSPIKVMNRQWDQMRGKWRGGRPMLPHHQGIFHRRRLFAGGSPFDISYRVAADSKLVYRSIERVDPVYVDVPVASVLLGGLSTDPRYVTITAREIDRVNRELGYTNRPHQSWFNLKVAVKSLIYQTGGERASKYFIDKYRRLTGRSSKWNNSEKGS